MMIKTWRWFGKKDRISLSMLRQIGVEGIVTALHDIPTGEVWPLKDILELQNYIESFGLAWQVVESLPVSEVIKYAGTDRDRIIDNYTRSLENLGKAGIRTVCYNFMPVIDWVRTDLEHRLEDGSYSLYFDKVRFAYFDIHILKRRGAESEYTPDILAKVDHLKETITEKEKSQLIDTVIVKTQGFISGNIKEGDPMPVKQFNKLLSFYDGINRDQLRENLRYFLQRIIPTCEKVGINMCIHPDDPPFPLLGLPRIVTDEEDIEWLLKAVDHPRNRLTFCAGSLSAGIDNRVAHLAGKFSSRTGFVHLRSTDILPGGDFIEASHLKGRGELIEVVRIFEKETKSLPMRVDHGRLMEEDKDKGHNPGYSFLGRMLAFGQMEGVMATVQNEINNK